MPHIHQKTPACMTAYRHTYKQRQTTICNSIHCHLANLYQPIIWNSPFMTPHPPKVTITPNQYFQDYHILPKSKLLKMSPFKTATISQNRNCPKSVLTRPPHSPQIENYSESVLSRTLYPLKVKTNKDQSFQGHHILQGGNCWKWLLSRPPHPPNMEKNLILQDHFTLSKCRLAGSFKPATPSQSVNCPTLVLSRLPSKMKANKNNPFKTITSSQGGNCSKLVKSNIPSQSWNCPKSLLSRSLHPPNWKLSKISPFKTPHPPKVKIIPNQLLQDHHILPIWKL